MVTKLYALIDKPRQPLLSNYDHWSIVLIQTQAQRLEHLDTSPVYTIIEVDGSPGTYIYARRLSASDPRATERFSAAFHIGDIADDSVTELLEILDEKCVVDNETTGWECQDFVLETLELIFDEGLLDVASYEDEDEDVRHWNRQMERLKELRGDNDQEDD